MSENTIKNIQNGKINADKMRNQAHQDIINIYNTEIMTEEYIKLYEKI